MRGEGREKGLAMPGRLPAHGGRRGAMGRHDETVAESPLVHDIVLLPDNRILVNDNDINVLLSLLGAD